MNKINLNNLVGFNPDAYALVLVSIVLVLVVVLILLQRKNFMDMAKKIDEARKDLQNELRFSVQPKFIDISLSTEALIELAVEIWRIGQKDYSSLPDSQAQGIKNSIKRLERFLEKHDIEIKDYTNQKFNEGLNLDVLEIEKDPAIKEPIIKKTVEPTILCKGQVVKRAKVVLLSN